MVGGDTHETFRVQTVLLSPELVSWREEEKLFSLRHWMHSTYPNPNFSVRPDLFFIGLDCCLCIWFSKGEEKAADVEEGQLPPSE